MIFLNIFKVGVIWLCDGITKLFYPFKKASYAANPDLAMVESQLYQHLKTSFVDYGRFQYELPMPADAGDAALFQGLYTAMVNMRYPEPNAETQQANAALGGYFVDGALIRGVRSDGTINDTTSNDSATGVLMGLYTIWRRSTFEADSTVRRWADRIIASGYALTDLQGNPTKYGQLEDGWKTDPLRLTLLLAILVLANHSNSPSPVYAGHYDQLYRKYRLLLKYPKVRLLWLDTAYDTHRAAIHLHILMALTGDPIYKDGLRRIHRMVEAESNPWVNALCYPAISKEEADLSMLNTVNMEHRVRGNIAVKNSMTVESVWFGKERSKIALPLWRREDEDFFWQRDMFTLDGWPTQETASIFHSGLDFLLAYWFGVRQGLIK